MNETEKRKEKYHSLPEDWNEGKEDDFETKINRTLIGVSVT